MKIAKKNIYKKQAPSAELLTLCPAVDFKPGTVMITGGITVPFTDSESNDLP